MDTWGERWPGLGRTYDPLTLIDVLDLSSIMDPEKERENPLTLSCIVDATPNRRQMPEYVFYENSHHRNLD